MDEVRQQTQPMATNPADVKVVSVRRPHDDSFEGRINAVLQDWNNEMYELVDIRFLAVSHYDGGPIEPTAYLTFRLVHHRQGK